MSTESVIIRKSQPTCDTVTLNKFIWKDGVLGAIDKLEKHNGCIIADSVGLGKTFEALAVIKYYELRNDRLLVLEKLEQEKAELRNRLKKERNMLICKCY